MSIFKTFYPDARIDSAYNIDYEGLYNKGIRGLIFDIDNTLVEHGYPADERAKELFVRLHNIGFDTVLLSNNKEKRVKPFATDVSSKYIYKADKPKKSGYKNAMALMKTDNKTTVFIGDQLFTDVWGAKRTGVISYLTAPIDPHEEIQIIIKRRLEKIVLHYYEKDIKKCRLVEKQDF